MYFHELAFVMKIKHFVCLLIGHKYIENISKINQSNNKTIIYFYIFSRGCATFLFTPLIMSLKLFFLNYFFLNLSEKSAMIGYRMKLGQHTYTNEQ